MKYIKSFGNHTEYETFTGTTEFILPNVSLCKQENEVHYNPSSPVPPTPTYEYVDLGLPSGTKWATMNVGATSVTDYGNYYQYGKGADTYQVTSGESVYDGDEDPLATSADTASQVWGGQWHMPTRAQMQELTANTTYQWVENFNGSGINGATFTANGQTLFIPAAGYAYDGSLNDVGAIGFIWSSTINTPSQDSFVFSFGEWGSYIDNEGSFTNGYSVRGVLDE